MTAHVSARRRIDRPLAEVFDFVRRPEHHSDFDASDTVGSTLSPRAIAHVGDVFTMAMTYTAPDGTATHYRTDNHVTRFEPGRVIEWAVAPADGEPLGWRWRYEFEAHGDAATDVTLTYDWAGTSDANIERYGVPAFNHAALDASLTLLDVALVAAHGDQPHVEGA